MFAESGYELQKKFYELLESAKTGLTRWLMLMGMKKSTATIQSKIQCGVHCLKAQRFGTAQLGYSQILPEPYRLPRRRKLDHDEIGQNTPETGPDTTMAITYGDWDDIDGTLEDWKEWFKLYEARSKLGAPPQIEYLYRCST